MQVGVRSVYVCVCVCVCDNEKREEEEEEEEEEKEGMCCLNECKQICRAQRRGDAITNYKASDINMVVCSWIEIYMIRGHMLDIF